MGETPKRAADPAVPLRLRAPRRGPRRRRSRIQERDSQWRRGGKSGSKRMDAGRSPRLMVVQRGSTPTTDTGHGAARTAGPRIRPALREKEKAPG